MRRNTIVMTIALAAILIAPATAQANAVTDVPDPFPRENIPLLDLPGDAVIDLVTQPAHWHCSPTTPTCYVDATIQFACSVTGGDGRYGYYIIFC